MPGARSPPPKHLDKPEKTLWRELMEPHRFEDAASLALLRTTLEAHRRVRKCREAIDSEGETVKDRFDQLKPHPLLGAERDARAAFLAGMRALNLDLSGA
ncbi:P27 family phage terminase small subunit [Microvirga sp. G4-2]|uniref:P27 family phage terminase small subunit n=1 Tax=Microvirga sp. G4-2 TaxID=3434467 RepID=UPI004044F03C